MRDHRIVQAARDHAALIVPISAWAILLAGLMALAEAHL